MTTPPQDGAHPSARLLVPTAEIGAGPEGPEVGAFFDLDGTLVAGYTAAAQTRDRLRRRDLRVVEFLTIVQLAVQFRLGRRAFELRASPAPPRPTRSGSRSRRGRLRLAHGGL
jgi:putative phosphoserine phosphatase/1-acylglycerol-3-phosphate O-acyltransferase